MFPVELVKDILVFRQFLHSHPSQNLPLAKQAQYFLTQFVLVQVQQVLLGCVLPGITTVKFLLGSL